MTMCATIPTWLDGYLELRHRAFADRGSIELSDGTRWPRTTGEQVAAIAAVFTPVLRANAAPHVLRRWRAVLASIQRDALANLHATYLGNRAFWAALEAVAAYLDNLALRPPARCAWLALFAIIDGDRPRNVGPSGDGPFKHFDGVQTFDDLYNAQFVYLRDLRGFDRVKPDGDDAGVERPIPRTTNADVVALADYWMPQLAVVKHVMGRDRVVAAWIAAYTDVGHLARGASPTAVYAKNNAFWRALQSTAIHVAVADEAPDKLDLAVDAVKDSIDHLPATLTGAAHKGVEAVAGAAHAAAHVVNEAGKGLVEGLGKPFLIGAGVIAAGVVGAALLFRSGRSHEEA